MAPIKDNLQKSKKVGPTEKEWKETQVVLTSILRTWKNYSLYPETHINCQTTLDKLHTQLEVYLKTHGRLKFEFTKGQLIFKGKEILSEPREEGNLTYNLFRDGIQWLEFQEGIEGKEVKTFFSILNQYRILSDEPDGDLVTALWSNPLPHIQYHVADFLRGTEPEIEFSTTPEFGDTASPSSQTDDKASREFESILPIDPESLLITPKELEELARMVRLEEARNPTPDYLDALIDCLLQHKQKENFDLILEALEEEFHDSIARKDFEITHRILKSLRYVLGYSEAGTPWVRPIIEKFFFSTRSSKALKPLQALWADMDEKQLAKVKEILLLFQPDSIETLGNMLVQTSSFKVQRMLMNVIFKLASRDYRPIEALLNRPEEELVRKLVNVLGHVKGEGPSQILFKMVHHSSALVRLEAINSLLRQEPENIQKLFSLINDESDSVRRIILNYMGQKKSSISEDFLLNYLGREKFKSSQEAHAIACFKTLGQCGSNRSIPFLKDTLNGRGGLKDFWKLTNRKGAAIALKTMGTKEATQILNDASRSFYPNIRYVARQVLQGQKK